MLSFNTLRRSSSSKKTRSRNRASSDRAGASQPIANRPAKSTRRRLLAEKLDARIVFAAIPAVTIDAPAEVFLGETADVSVTFDNAHATDAGFGPFVDVLLPRNGADGVNGVDMDGFSYVTGSANFLGAALTTTVLVFPNDGGGVGAVDHPYAVDNTGTPLQVTGNTGDQLLVFQLPFGSFAGDQPGATIDFQTTLSSDADLGTSLDIRARGGFQFGNDELNNPASDPSLVSQASSANAWTPVASIDPILVEMTKTYIGPENETATGPNFPRQYTIEIDVADGQTITDNDFTDLLPNNVELISVDTITPAGSTTNFPATPANVPNNDLTINIPSITGTTASVDASITFSYFIPFRDADSAIIIDPASGDDVVVDNNIALLGDWTPTDPGDTGSTTNNVIVDVAGPEETMEAKSIAVQKSVSLQNDAGGAGYSGGDTVEYTINFQVSDFHALDTISLDDYISDGQRFDTTFSPTLTVIEHGLSSTGNISPSNYDVTDHFTGGTPAVAPIDGSQQIEFFVSNELVLRGADAVLLGGLVPVGGTTGTDPDEATFDGGPTTGQIVFRAIVQDDFTDDFPSGDSSIDEGDLLSNDISIDGRVLSYTNLAPQLTESDTSATEFVIVGGTLTKSIYAINGSTTLPSPFRLTPGDEITYRVELTLPNSDIEGLRLDDYLPLPVLDSAEVTTFADTVSAAIPAAGQAKFGPTDTFRALFGTTPTLDPSAAQNRVSFVYGDFDIDPSQSSKIDILFTVTASADQFADGLFLTNQVRRTQDSTNQGTLTNDAIVQIQLAQPVLNIKKGIVATTNTAGVYTPTTTGPVSFSAPGTAGFRGSGTINSSGIAANPIDSDLSLVDAGDLVTFTIVVENTGSSRKGAYDVRVRDALPPGFQIPTGGAGLNLNVSDGTGAAIPTTTIGTGLFDPSGGIELNDPGTTPDTGDGTDGGALDQYDPTDGRNLLIITYDLEVLPSANPNQLLTSDATLYNYASVETGPDYTLTDLIDPASTRVEAIAVAKTLTTTSESTTTGNDVAIGEVITYTSTISVPEGDAANVVWTDTPDNGLAIVAVDSIVASSGSVTSSNGAIGSLSTTIPADGSSASIDFGTITNADRNNAVDETITITYRAIVLNTGGNNRGVARDNTAVATWTGGSDNTDGPDVTIVEPQLAIVKNISPATGQAADIFTVTLDVAHTAPSNADAFDVSLSDVLPAGLSFNSGTLSSSGLAPTTLSESSGTITATWSTFPDSGATSQISFNVTADASVVAGTTITNNADIDWTSLPGDVTTPITTNGRSVERTGDTGDPGGAANDYNDTDSDTVVVIAPVLSKTLVSTNAAHTTGANVAIGEIVTYDVVFEVPNGTMPNAVFVDTPDAGLSIVGVTSVVASSTDLSTTNTSFANVASTAVISANGNSVTFDFGDLTNANTAASTETITMRYTAVVVNENGNDRGLALDNQGTLTWGVGNSVPVDGPDVTIVEPEVTVSTSIAPATGQANDVFTVTVTVDHTAASNADAFDLALTNSIPAGLVFDGSLASASGTAPTLSESGGVVTATWPSLTQTQDNTFTYQARLASNVESGTTVNNPVAVTWTSLPGDITTAQSTDANSTERTGTTSNPGGAENDHADTATDSVTTIQPTATKTLTATNQSQTTGNNVAIGEIATYQIQLTIPQGVTNTVQVVDTPDAGLAIVDVVSVVADTGITSSAGTFASIGTAATIPADGSSLTLNFGNLTNADTTSGVAETVTITYRAVVLNESFNDRGDVLDNAANFTWNTGSIALDGPDLTVVEPELVVTTNIVETSGQASDLVEVIMTIDHTVASNADAMDVVLTDVLPAGLVYDSGLTHSAGTAPTTLAHSSGTITATFPTLTTTQASEIRFFARLAPTVQPAEVITNPAVVTHTSIAGDVTTAQSSNALSTERTGSTSDPGAAANDHIDNASDTITVISPQISKTLTATNAAHTLGTDVAIGEIVTYQVSLVIPQGVTGSASFVDTPTTGLAIVAVDSITAPADITSSAGTMAAIASAAVVGTNGQDVTIGFGNLTNANTNSAADETITITYRAVVLDDTNNDRSDILDNAAAFTWTNGTINDDAADLTVVEPQLAITVSNGSPATADAGDPVTFQVDLAHAPSSDADAFDVDLQNLINSVANHLQYSPGSIVVTPSAGVGAVTTDETGGDLNLNISSFPQGETLSFTFVANVQNSAPASTSLSNDATVQWTSLPGAVSTPQAASNTLSVERTGAGFSTPGSPDDHQTADAGTVTTNAPSSTKVVVATSQPDTTLAQFNATVDDVLVGEEVTYEITAVIPEGTNTLEITDQLPLGIEYVSASVVSVGSSLTAPAPTITPGDSNADTINDNVVVDFGSLFNNPDGSSNAGDEVVISVTGRVRDFVGNVNSTTLQNTATVDLSGATAIATADVEVVEPVLEIIKSSPLSNGPPGTIENFTLTIQHTGASAAIAYDLTIDDLFNDPNLTLIPGTVTTDRGTITSGNGVTDSTVGLDLSQLAIGDVITITFDGLINPSAGGGATIDWPADLTWDSIPGTGGRVGTDADPEPFTTTAPIIDLGVTINDDVDPNVVDSTLIYTVVVTNNGPSTATGTTVVTTLDPNVTSPSATTTLGTTSVSGLIVTGNVGTLLPGQSETITITVTTPSTAQTINSSSAVSAVETDVFAPNDTDTEPTIILATSSVAGSTWVDLNQDGVRDAGELPLPGTLLVLTGIDDNGAAVNATTTTDTNGDYIFDLLRPGTYQVQQVQPTLFLDGIDELGTGGGSVLANDSYEVTLPAGVSETGYDFTERGLRPEFMSKRRLLTSRASTAPAPIDVDDFYAIFAPSGGGDLDSDLDVDAADYSLFLDRLGEAFAI
ncbi:MAG: isopeptide-forming domain-containing fimbrial protein [Pirellulaceae bacterium]